MAKLADKEIDAKDLTEYLDSVSDFEFELKVLQTLIRLGYRCEHGGTYKDAATGKPREFDIRAILKRDYFRIALAVECKNLRAHFPLLVSCVPRRANESFHDVIAAFDPDKWPQSGVRSAAFDTRCKQLRVGGGHSRYAAKAAVGKSCAQVGRAAHGSLELTATDGDIYDKWAQAIGSASDLVDLIIDEPNSRDEFGYGVVLPIVCVPDGRLWAAHHNEAGDRIGDPLQEPSLAYYVGHDYFRCGEYQMTSYTVSHVEFMTFSALAAWAESLTNDGIGSVLPEAHLDKLLEVEKYNDSHD